MYIRQIRVKSAPTGHPDFPIQLILEYVHFMTGFFLMTLAFFATSGVNVLLHVLYVFNLNGYQYEKPLGRSRTYFVISLFAIVFVISFYYVTHRDSLLKRAIDVYSWIQFGPLVSGSVAMTLPILQNFLYHPSILNRKSTYL